MQVISRAKRYLRQVSKGGSQALAELDECSKITTVIANYSVAPHGLESGITYQSINNNMYALHNGRRRLRPKEVAIKNVWGVSTSKDSCITSYVAVMSVSKSNE